MVILVSFLTNIILLIIMHLKKIWVGEKKSRKPEKNMKNAQAGTWKIPYIN